jgi:uncharacterized membrane protein HdeD (DUF308 family)
VGVKMVKKSEISNNSKKQPKESRIRKGALVVNRIYKTVAPLLVGEAILFTVVAILMMVKPLEIMTAVTFVIGAVLILFGLYRVSMVFVSNMGIGVGSLDMFFGLVTLVLGIVFCAYPRGATIGVIYVFVVLFLMNALRLLFFSINMARLGFGQYKIDLVGAIVMILLSTVLLFLPNLAIGVLVWFLAIYLLLYAVADIYMFVKLLRLRIKLGAYK